MSTSTTKRQRKKQRCPKCLQLAIIEIETTRKTETETTRIKRCSLCERKWSRVEKV